MWFEHEIDERYIKCACTEINVSEALSPLAPETVTQDCEQRRLAMLSTLFNIENRFTRRYILPQSCDVSKMFLFLVCEIKQLLIFKPFKTKSARLLHIISKLLLLVKINTDTPVYSTE